MMFLSPFFGTEMVNGVQYPGSDSPQSVKKCESVSGIRAWLAGTLAKQHSPVIVIVGFYSP